MRIQLIILSFLVSGCDCLAFTQCNFGVSAICYGFRSKVYGVMYKWTNFVYGWQKRYFELENGVLVYYKSEAEKHNGSRGSIALRVAHLVVSLIISFPKLKYS